MLSLRRIASSVALLLALPSLAFAQMDWDNVEIKTTELAPGVYALEGVGGRMGVSVGADGIFLIDDDFGQLNDKIDAALAQLSDNPVVFVLNTHWHGDHTGGNEEFAKDGVWLMAHHNVRTRVSTEQYRSVFDRTDPAKPEIAWPDMTFDSEMRLHINDHEIYVFHAENAHTDGDAIVHFENRNVIHCGDVFWNGNYPYIDVDSGGNARGMLRAANRILLLTDGSTKVVPGHGPIGNREDLRAFRDMLQTAISRIEALVAQGLTLQQINDQKPMADYDDAWGGGFIDPKRFVQLVYLSLQ